jgi:UDP-3-O-[3-hydroxymyristoyl] glucosamine N-acyltransferase
MRFSSGERSLQTLARIAEKLEARLEGDGNHEIARLGTIQSAESDALTFLANPRYRGYLEKTRAGAVLCTEDQASFSPVPVLIVKDPYLAYARISHDFDVRPQLAPGVHPSAVVDASVSVPETVHIGPNVVIESGVTLGDGCILMAGCYVGVGCELGKSVRLWPHVTLYHGVRLGDRCNVHASTVIGADGFGFAFAGDGWERVAQVGGVAIGDDVDIGAGTTIDRGAVDDTRIGDGVIIDNQVQVAHNVVIGNHTALAGKVGIAGSAKIGSFCMIGGAVGISGHIEICDKVQLLGMTLVTGNITEPGTYASANPMDKAASWRKNAVRFRHLDDIYHRLRRLEDREN